MIDDNEKTGFKDNYTARRTCNGIYTLRLREQLFKVFKFVWLREKTDPETVAKKFAIASTAEDYSTFLDFFVVDYEEFIKQLNADEDDWSMEKYLDELGKQCGEYGEELDSLEDYYAYIRDVQNATLMYNFGNEYEIIAEIVSSEDVDIAEVKAELEQIYQDDEIKAMKKCDFDINDYDDFKCVTVETNIEGSLESGQYDEMDIYLVKIDGAWKVIARSR